MSDAIALTSLSKNGQIGLPKDIQEKLGVEIGDRVAYIERDNEIVIKKATITVFE
jgi:AbrB family looped-hinge helix DNA binding protein